jgi:hypothetical protein
MNKNNKTKGTKVIEPKEATISKGTMIAELEVRTTKPEKL